MCFVPSFLDLLQPLSCLMTTPSFDRFVTVLTGWVFARRRTISGMILAADAACGAKHHWAYHRVFAAARWSLDEVGLAIAAMQPQNWSPKAVQRTAPVAMLLYTLIIWWFSQIGHHDWQPLARP